MTYSPLGFVTAHYRARQGRRRRGRPDPARHHNGLRPARVRAGPRQPVSVTHGAPRAPRHRHRRPRRRAGRGDRLGRSTPTGSAGCCRPAPRPRTSCSATRSSAAGCSRPTRSAPVGETVGRSRPARRPGQRRGQRLADLRQQGPGRARSTSRSSPPATTYAPPQDAQLGQKAMMFYDPRGQLIRTVNPDGSQTVVVLGVPTDLDRPDSFRAHPVGDLHLRRQRQRRPHPPRRGRRVPRPLEHPGQHRGRRPRAAPSPRPPATAPTRHRPVHHPHRLRHPGQPRHGHRRPRPRSRSATASTCSSAAGGWTASTPAAATPCSTPSGTPVEARDSQGRAHPRRLRPAAPARSGSGHATTRRRAGHAAAAHRLRRRRRPGPGRLPTAPAAARPQPARPAGRPLRRGRAGHRPATSTSRATAVDTTRQVIADAPILATYDRRGQLTAGRSTPFTSTGHPRPARPRPTATPSCSTPTGYTHDTRLRRAQPGHPAHAAHRRRRAPRRPHPDLQPRRRAGGRAGSTTPSTSSASPTTPRASAR